MARAYLTRRRGGGERSLNQLVKKVGTPRRRCPKHQAQRAVSGIQRRLHPSRCATTAWQVRRERRTATARHPYLFGKGRVARSLKQIVKKVGTPRHPYLFLELVCIEVIVSLQLDFAAQKKGGMAVPAVRRLVYFLAPCPLEPSSRQQHTGETRCAPLLKSKSKRLLVLGGIWDDFQRPFFDVGESPFFLLGFGRRIVARAYFTQWRGGG